MKHSPAVSADATDAEMIERWQSELGRPWTFVVREFADARVRRELLDLVPQLCIECRKGHKPRGRYHHHPGIVIGCGAWLVRCRLKAIEMGTGAVAVRDLPEPTTGTPNVNPPANRGSGDGR
jgi:hypothetical protein